MIRHHSNLGCPHQGFGARCPREVVARNVVAEKSKNISEGIDRYLGKGSDGYAEGVERLEARRGTRVMEATRRSGKEPRKAKAKGFKESASNAANMATPQKNAKEKAKEMGTPHTVWAKATTQAGHHGTTTAKHGEAAVEAQDTQGASQRDHCGL